MSTMTPPPAIADKYAGEGTTFMTGVQALVRVPLEQRAADERAGLDTALFISGYPGSPLGGYDLELARAGALLAERGIVHRTAVNEELAATAILGSQRAHTVPGARHEGVVGLWYGKAPGLDRSGDALRHGNIGGVAPAGGVLVAVGDDPMAKSSTVPSASEATLAALLMPVLYPGDPQEVFDLGLHGIAMSRCSGLWVGMKMANDVADGSGSVQVGPGRVAPVMVEAVLDGRPYRHEPTRVFLGAQLHAAEHSLVHARLPAAIAYARANGLNRITQSAPGDTLGIVAAGKTYVDLRQAMADLGVDDDDLGRLGVRLLHVRMPFPLDGELVREFAEGLDELMVLEDKQPLLERQVKDELYDLRQRPAVVGKRDRDGSPLARADGELDADAVALLLGDRLAGRGAPASVDRRVGQLRGRAVLEPLAVTRGAYFCSGCPHNSSLKAPAGALVAAGIGCHGMVHFMGGEHDGVGTVIGMTQMGGEGAQWIGQAPFTDTRHIFQNLGDGTFHHSGSLAVRAAVAAGVTMTYKLMFNAHVSMTGGQAATGAMAVPDVARSLLAEGVRRVIVTTEDPGRWAGRMPEGVEVRHRDGLVAAQSELAAIDGVTVLIHDQECAAEVRRARKRGTVPATTRRVLINERVCEGCGDCGTKSNCLSVRPVDTEFGRKTQIHQASCNQDLSCLKGDCPSFVTIVPAAARPRAARGADLDAGALPPVAAPSVRGEFALRLCGIGGTGVVTVAQVLATAAILDGWHVRGTDQTGLAQKGGAVVSDLRLGPEPLQRAGRLSAAGCDLFLAADVIAAGAPANLAAADPGRTTAVVSTTSVPTGRMVADVAAGRPPTDALVQRILDRCRPGEAVVLDAGAAAERLFGTDVVANMLMVGAALQAGALPVDAACIEQAIAINGVAIDLNVQALRRGRQAVADPAAFARAIAPAAAAAPAGPALGAAQQRVADRVRAAAGGDLARSVALRVAELDAYQDLAYATRFADRVERVRAAEERAVPGEDALAQAVAFSLHKLMAYKDEYEVARLHLDPRLREEVAAEFGDGARMSYRLHPPLLRALGHERKLELGPWFDPALRALRAGRRLRGTPLDVFGRTEVRRAERAVLAEYEALADELAARVTPETHAVAVELARLPDAIRGYESIKLAAIARHRARVAELRGLLDAPPILDVVHG
ncbi:indolepyruvate ferredoxin oxidoreductase family protein [Baekduia soli]|uniref:Indolepyruvate ferredoxin oxidoreductase family protein n=1 Tax=Baekduia soli TaxID=496014 RepID=A0A5B8U0N2_9ACTN|nr:indolepyruvate ferredoxin oxidoreductase family protein [Baekduia soli]QEC46512.1 indolepyruvate ferredoxin oxidoreductase family protein [Baekduia soli]